MESIQAYTLITQRKEAKAATRTPDMITNFLASILGFLPFACLKAQFMQRATAEIILLAPLCALMGTLTIRFRMAFFSDAIAHSAFTGIALGLLLSINPWVSLVVFAMFIGALTSRMKQSSELTMDTTLGVIFSTNIALGLAIISFKKGLGKSLPGFLYGDILSVTDFDISATFILLIIVIAFLWVTFNRLIFLSLHEDLAKASDIPANLLETAFSVMLALVVAFSIKAVGILLVTALLIIPSAAAGNTARSISGEVWLSLLFSFLSCFAGMATSVYADISTGPAIILWSSGIFGISLFMRNNQ